MSGTGFETCSSPPNAAVDACRPLCCVVVWCCPFSFFLLVDVFDVLDVTLGRVGSFRFSALLCVRFRGLISISF